MRKKHSTFAVRDIRGKRDKRGKRVVGSSEVTVVYEGYEACAAAEPSNPRRDRAPFQPWLRSEAGASPNWQCGRLPHGRQLVDKKSAGQSQGGSKLLPARASTRAEHASAVAARGRPSANTAGDGEGFPGAPAAEAVWAVGSHFPQNQRLQHIQGCTCCAVGVDWPEP